MNNVYIWISKLCQKTRAKIGLKMLMLGYTQKKRSLEKLPKKRSYGVHWKQFLHQLCICTWNKKRKVHALQCHNKSPSLNLKAGVKCWQTLCLLIHLYHVQGSLIRSCKLSGLPTWLTTIRWSSDWVPIGWAEQRVNSITMLHYLKQRLCSHSEWVHLMSPAVHICHVQDLNPKQRRMGHGAEKQG